MGNVCSISISSDSVLSRCLDCTARHPNYAFQLEKNLVLLRNDWDELKRRRNDIKRRIDVEERDPQMKRLEVVDGWLLLVDAMEAEVEKLIRDAGSQESLNKCLGGCCPKNCRTSYKLGKQVVRNQQEVVDLNSRGIFDVVTDRVSLPPVYERPAEPTSGLESTFDEVWRSFKDEKVAIMGLYGMGGVGKTSLLTQIYNKLCNSTQDVDVVIWVVVSKNLDLTKLQDDIGEKIGFYGDEWKNKNQDNKAIDIFRVLKEKKYALLLDDIWERLDLTNLGVPPPNSTNMSKVIFTTRSKEVCGRMEAHKHIKVKCLGEEEAWNLFKKKVGEEALNAHPEIPELAKVVAKECGGLPLALITTGRAMTCKMTPRDWIYAIEVLKGCTSAFSGMEEEVFSRLKFSYDCLPNDAIRSCLLYCSLYPEDENISKEELIDKWICEDFLVKFDDFHKARNEGHDYINTLVHASLLEESLQFPECIKMHDLIRDMAIWIGCECGEMDNKFFIQVHAGLTKTPTVAKWEGTKRVSLMNNEIAELTGTPKCPNLVTLFLNVSNQRMLHDLKIITSGFFQSMPNLRVLDLAGHSELRRLPRDFCELVSLQYLNLSSTGLEELPMGFPNLIKLKFLDLSFTPIHKIAGGVLSSFKELRILYLSRLGWSNALWDGLPNTSVKELETLEYLSHLAITITSDFALSDFSQSRKLTSITTGLDLLYFNDTSRYLDLLFLKETTRLRVLTFKGLKNIEEINIGKGNATSTIINQNCFSRLRRLEIFSCPMLKDLTWLLAFAPNLEDIAIWICGKMKMVGGAEWDENAAEEGGRPIPFAKVGRMVLVDLPELESICQSALPFPCLKELKVLSGCPKLKKLPFNSSSCRSGCGIIINAPAEWWNGLEWEDEDTRNAFLPSFKPY